MSGRKKGEATRKDELIKNSGAEVGPAPRGEVGMREIGGTGWWGRKSDAPAYMFLTLNNFGGHMKTGYSPHVIGN
jgi:hypothetical protein